MLIIFPNICHNLPPEILNRIKCCQFNQVLLPGLISVIIVEPEAPGVLQGMLDEEFRGHLGICGALGLCCCGPLEHTSHHTQILT